MTPFLLAGRTILLTGAGRGIGRGLLDELVKREVVRIIVVGRDENRLRGLQRQYAQVEAIAADLSIGAQLSRIVDQVRAFAELSVLINNAGTQQLTELMDSEADLYRSSLAAEMAVNFSAPIELTVALLPQLLRQPSAMIVNVTSGLALAPKQSAPVYCAAKAGLRSFTKALRYQSQARAPHLRVVEALPPLVDTDMTNGRGRGKISAEACAAEIVAGMEGGRHTIYVGKTKLLRMIQGFSPSLADRVMRRG